MPGCSPARSWLAVLAGWIADPFPLLGIDVAPRGMVASYHHRPFLGRGRRREQHVLAEYPFLRVFPRGGEAGDLGEVAFTVLVVTGQIVGEFIDPLGDHLAEHGEERAGVADLLVDLREAAFPLPPCEFAVVVQRRMVAAAGRIGAGRAHV